MKTSVAAVAFECFVDLGITVVYAAIVGLLIVGIVASDDGPMSVVMSMLYASVLPGAVLLLVAIELAFRIGCTWRDQRKNCPMASRHMVKPSSRSA